jgi:hypothetical protein
MNYKPSGGYGGRGDSLFPNCRTDITHSDAPVVLNDRAPRTDFRDDYKLCNAR